MASAGFTTPAQDAVHATLLADAPLAAFLGATASDPRLYDGAAPPGTSLWTSDDPVFAVPRPYVVYAEMSEDAVAALCETDGAAYEIPWDVKVWTPDAMQYLARVGYGHLRRILHGRTWSVTGGILTAAVSLRRTLTDPDGRATQAIARVELIARPA